MTDYWTEVYSYGSMLYQLLRIGAKSHLDYVEISKNCALNHRHVAVWSFIRKCGTHLAQSFFIWKRSFKTLLTHPDSIFTMSAIFLTFTVRSSKTIKMIYLVFSGVDVSIGSAERVASFVLVHFCCI